MAESTIDKNKRLRAIGGSRGRGGLNNDAPRGDDIVSRLTTDPKGGTSKFTFPMNGSDGAKYPANTMKKNMKSHDNLVTPGKWTTKKGC